MPKEKILLLIIFVFLLGAASPYLCYWAFYRFVQPSLGGRDEVVRITSPDGVLDAVVMRVNPAAFSSFLYDLYLVPTGTKKIEGIEDPILHTSEGDAPTIRWEKSQFFTVDAGDSDVTYFGNLWYSTKGNDYYVELTGASGKHYLKENGRLRSE
jgi:hypothetical protein